MRYSEVLRSFYQIRLIQEDCDLLDTHFTASAHHFIRLGQGGLDDVRYFHEGLFRRHLMKMLSVVYKRADFSEAVDPSGMGLEERSSWDPDRCSLPDPEMFDAMSPDPRFQAGMHHVSDVYVTLNNNLDDEWYSAQVH